jgi:N-acetylglucosaminyldiphosphoundecaprenol N-acetyl-beta-D-mannosaminyltransferase
MATAHDCFPAVYVGPFRVTDLGARQLIEAMLESFGSRRTAFALHVGGLNYSDRRTFVEAMASASIVYADGVSVAFLARLGGARRVRRTSTTDLGWDILEAFAVHLKRRCRIAIIGGPPGLAERAGRELERLAPVELIGAADGYRESYTSTLSSLSCARPDIVVVGMGMPAEAEWVNRHIEHLPECLIITCGGWLGFITGAETRAPWLVRSLGLEWSHRLMHNPRRLWKRYATGLITTTRLTPMQVARRVRRSGAQSRAGLHD